MSKYTHLVPTSIQSVDLKVHTHTHTYMYVSPCLVPKLRAGDKGVRYSAARTCTLKGGLHGNSNTLHQNIGTGNSLFTIKTSQQRGYRGPGYVVLQSVYGKCEDEST